MHYYVCMHLRYVCTAPVEHQLYNTCVIKERDVAHSRLE